MRDRRRLPPRLASALAAALAAVLVVVACAAGPGPTAVVRPAASAPGGAQARANTNLVGAQGPVGEAQKSRDLARVAAEGRAADLERHFRVLAQQGDFNLYRGNRVIKDAAQVQFNQELQCISIGC